jgi:UDP-GlcNAc:undecaprenyl-phosphate GlcNAc-1-phosphate transferase
MLDAMSPHMIKTYFSYFSAAFIIALFMVPPMRQLSFRLNALDWGTGRRVHEGIVPRLGGVGIYLAFAIPMVVLLLRGSWAPGMQMKMGAILAASTLVLLIGVYDDMKSASIRNKLFAEVCAGLIIFAAGARIDVLTNPFDPGSMIQLGWMSLPVTLLWIVVITNAINLTDGLDGLAAGTGIFISVTLLVVTGAKDMVLGLTLVILIGSLLGFLRHNFPPATIFMGDSGSLFTGFILGSYTIVSSGKATAMATVMLPILAFGLPLLDMSYAVLRRHHRGLPLGEADREHIHHKLLDMGLSKKSVLFTLYAVNLCLMVVILLFLSRHFSFRYLGVTLMAVVAVVAVAGLQLLGYVNFSSIASDQARGFRLSRQRRYFAYLVRSFGRNAAMAGSGEEMETFLERLFRQYRFGAVDIFLEAAGAEPVYSYRAEEDAPVRLEFPVRGEEGLVGRVVLQAGGDEDGLLCASELMQALSTVLTRTGAVFAAGGQRLR